ncbi:MAG TPA: PAS domain S-box protein [Methanoregulaceae archaeon]|nr:PAS domain S-box protein [Methanoregulaceae archaeon]
MISILLVDDEPALLDLTRIFLEREPEIAVTICSSAFEALRTQKIDKFNVIISDYEMPVMNGIDFLKELRSKGCKVPFIIFTGRGREEVVIEAINNGADFYLQKSGDPKVIFTQLNQMIRQSVEQQRIQADFIKSERRFYEIINSLPDATFAIDYQGKVIAWNHAMEELTGVPRAEMLGKDQFEYAIPFYGTRQKMLLDLILEKEDDLQRFLYKKIRREGHDIIAETDVSFIRGRPVVLWIKATPLFDEEHTIIGAIETIRDITAFDKSGSPHLHTEIKAGQMTEMLPQPVFMMDLEGRITYANKRGFEMFGIANDQLNNGLFIHQIISPSDFPRMAKNFQMILDGIPSHSGVYQAKSMNGILFPVQIFSSPVLCEGRVTGMCGIIIDLAEINPAGERINRPCF